MRMKVAAGLGVLALVVTVTFLVTSRVEAPVAESVAGPAALPTTIERADTPEKRTQGLSGRAAIADDYGMLFVFPADGRHGFWMKDMQVAIDIVWISLEGVIVHIEHAVAPSTYPTVFTPPAAARYVLETRAGYATERGWKVGTALDLSGQ